MSLEYAILGFLNYHPYTGYDLKKIFDTSIRHFWPADQSQDLPHVGAPDRTRLCRNGKGSPRRPPRP